jgi:hypothetical protein
LEAGTTDDLVSELGHEPNGYFWEGTVELLITAEAPSLEGRFVSDPEGGAYFATSNDRDALDDLAVLLRSVVVDGIRLRQFMEYSEANGFEFDD